MIDPESSMDVPQIVQTDASKKILGRECVSLICNAILEDEYIGFDYIKYNSVDSDEGRSGIQTIKKFIPYVLKEHKGRWYVIGKYKITDKNVNKITHAPLRILISHDQF